MISLREFEEVIENLPVAILLVDREQRILAANKKAYKVFGYTEGALVGESLLRFMSPDFHEEHTESFREFIGKHTGSYVEGSRCFMALDEDGRKRTIAINFGSTTVDGHPCGIAAVRDISGMVDRLTQLKREVDDVKTTLDNRAECSLKEPQNA